MKLEEHKFLDVTDDDAWGTKSYFIIDKIISETSFISDSEEISLNCILLKYADKKIWKPKKDEFCVFPYGKDSFAVSQVKEIDGTTVYFVNDCSEDINDLEPFTGKIPMFLRYLRKDI